MHPLLLSSDFDPFQMAIIVIALLAGFVKWLWENWQQKSGAMPVPPPDPEEQRLREAAWRKQTGQTSAAPPPARPVVAPSPWDELRKAWQELKEVAGQAPGRPAPRTPPPLPQRQQQPLRQQQPPQRARQAQPAARATASAPVQRPVATAAAAPIPAVASAPAVVVVANAVAPAGSVLATLRHLRRDPALMRQAILMQEILGPPKALQSSRDFAI